MKIYFKNKEFRYHDSGLWIAKDGEVYVPESGKHPAHFTYGCVNSNGYLQVRYKSKNYKVHILVAECFIPNPDILKTVDHYNRIRTDNRVKNLRWADRGTQNQNRDNSKFKNCKPVYQYTLDGELVKIWPSTQECGRNGFNQGAVWACCNGKLKHYKGHDWSYNLL